VSLLVMVLVPPSGVLPPAGSSAHDSSPVPLEVDRKCHSRKERPTRGDGR
jgi:hypothetical protein